jgi:phytoene desaturase
VSRVLVIGAGMGGLAVAARLAATGHRVVVCEQAGTHGGKLGSVERDGFVFDTGPSLLTLPAVYRDLFLKTLPPGTRKGHGALEDVVDLQPVEPGFAYRFGDGTRVELPGVGPRHVASALGDALGGHAAHDWNRLIDRGARMWAVTREPFIERPLDGLGDLASMAWRIGDVRTVAPWRTLRGLGRSLLRDERLVTLLDRYATYSGSDPRRAPAALATIPYVEQTFGAWHVGGGLRALGDALFARCEALGVEFRFASDVDAVSTGSSGVVDGVRLTDGTVIDADVVVADADAAHLYTDLVQDPRRSRPLRDLDRATPSLSGFTLLLSVRGRTPGVVHHNVWFPGDYDAEFDAIFGRHARPVDDPTVYACVPDDPAMRPDGHEAWSLLVNAPRHGSGAPGTGTVDWDAPGLAESYADRVLDRLASRGVDVRERLVHREIRTPADLERETRAPGGSIYGTSSNGMRAAFLRPANRSPVPGLFLVGGSSHPGGGLPLVGTSAAIVADLVGPA